MYGIHTWLAPDLVQIDDGESIGLSLVHVPHTEVVPLGVLVGVEVKGQVQLIIPLSTAGKKCTSPWPSYICTC